MPPSDVCPTEDAVGVFLEHLVDPLLPAKSSTRETPSLLLQQSVAKQVHAVVILYNYYHRKQCLQLDFLYFSSFCKLAAVLRPVLMAYMNFMKRSDDVELTDPEKQLSVTERTIMDACDICMRLDASKETPSIEGWPISKVTVLLVDSRKENCWLLFGSVAQRVWSMIEKSVDEASQNPESTTKRKRISRRPVRDDPGLGEDTLKHLAFSAVKEAAGNDVGDLLVLESHVVYSLSKEKSVSRFYIIECSKHPNAQVSQIPVKDVIDRFQGPLITRSANSWCITSVVEYCPMLPYAGILLSWFSREAYPYSSPNLKVKLETLNSKETDSKIETQECINRSNASSTIEGGGKKALEFCTALPKRSNERNSTEVLSCDSSMAQDMDVDGVPLPIEDKGCEVPGVMQVESLQEKKITDMNRDLIGLSSVIKKEQQGEFVESVLQKGGPERIGEKNDGGNSICCPTSYDDDRIPSEDYALVIHQGHSKAFDKVHALLASREDDLSQTALSVLLGKRASLSLQLRNIEDEIALCDKNIHIVQNGGEDALALKLECVIDACSNASITSVTHENSCLVPHTKKDLMSKVTLIEKNPCQELDDVCTENKWILPIYHVSPCGEGGFIATVTVKCTESEISANGDPQPVPYKARESAASDLLGKLGKV